MKILGISCYYHDSAAALIEDGKIIAAAQEERFTRKKHDSAFPSQAISFCLKISKITPSDLDWIIFYEKPFTKFERITLSSLTAAPKARNQFVDAYKTWLKSKLWIKATLAKELKIPSQKILFSDHHLSHAASSFYTSPFKSAALLTVDGVGEWTTTAWGTGQDNRISLKYENRFPHSLGLFYSAFTQYLGFQINEGEYKVMGLSPYGSPIYADKIGKIIHQSTDGSFQLNLKYFNFHLSNLTSYNQNLINLLGKPPVKKGDSDKVQKFYADVAASAQLVLEEKLLVIAKHLRKVTNEKNLCYSGGVALNGVANWRIFQEAGFENIFIHPAAGDAGGALGAALYLYHHVLGKPRRPAAPHVYWGKDNSEEEIKSFLTDQNIKATKLTHQQLTEQVVTLLLKKKVVGWVRGRFEWGPRALGARSILADPRDKKMKDLVNAKIKFREAFRPFAPVCTYEKGAQYFAVGRAANQQPLQYMIAVVPVAEKHQSKLGAITHVNGTARPQFIKKSQNKLYHDVIKSFGQATGVEVLLNTSFNLKGEPIVNTPQDAFKTFSQSQIDALVLGNYLILK